MQLMRWTDKSKLDLYGKDVQVERAAPANILAAGVLTGGHVLRVDEPQNGGHHLVQWRRCSNLVTGNPAQQRLNRLEVVKEAA
jgi:hypothetical protein